MNHEASLMDPAAQGTDEVAWWESGGARGRDIPRLCRPRGVLVATISLFYALGTVQQQQ
jgi:hypothetical protein